MIKMTANVNLALRHPLSSGYIRQAALFSFGLLYHSLFVFYLMIFICTDMHRFVSIHQRKNSIVN